jgi:hypothetical protein
VSSRCFPSDIVKKKETNVRNKLYVSAGLFTIMVRFSWYSGLIRFGLLLFFVCIIIFEASGPVGLGSIVEPGTRGSMLVKSLLTLVALSCSAVMTAILNPFSERRMALQLF